MVGADGGGRAGPGDPGFHEGVAVKDRSDTLTALPWPGPMVVACGGAERLLVAVDEIYPDDVRPQMHTLMEDAWREVMAPAATQEEIEEHERLAAMLYDRVERLRSGFFTSLVCMLVGLVWHAMHPPYALTAVWGVMKEGLEGHWADAELRRKYGSGDHYSIDDIYASDAFARELAALDRDIATVQQHGVTVESVAEIRQRAQDVGMEHRHTIIRALTSTRPPPEGDGGN